jgi:hypothetical protein
MKALFKLPPLLCVRQSRIVPEKLRANGIWFLIPKHRTEQPVEVGVVYEGMNLMYLFGLLEGLLVLAIAANRLFRWIRIPGVVVLMAAGVVIGPSSSSIGFLQFCM